MTDEFLFQDNKNHTVCINPTKGTLNEKPINELLLKADVENKADKEYVIEKVQEEHDRADATYATKEDVENKADKETVDMLAQTVSSHDRALMEDGQQLKELEKGVTELRNTKADSTWIAGYVDATKEYIFAWTEGTYPQKHHTHSISDITNLQETLNRKSAVGHTHTSSEITDLQETLETKADKTYVNKIYQSLIGTKNIETIVGDFSFNEENKYFRWQFVHSLKNGTRHKLIPKNNNEMYVSYIKNDGTQVKVPLDNNCYLNLYGDEQNKYFRVYEMVDMILPDPSPAPYYYDYGADDKTPHVDPKKQTLYLDYYRYKRYNAIDKTRIVYYYEDDRNKYYSQDFTYPENIRLYYKKYSDTNQKKPEIVALYFKFKRDNPIISHMFDLMNPVGSIYTSMDARGPQVMFGVGAWEQIVDRFLYCANSSKETGGSKTISGENLPAHSHYIDLSTSQAGWHRHRYWGWTGMTKGKGYDVKDDVKFAINCYWDDTWGEGDHTHHVSGYTQTTGQSKDYMPPYMTVYAWYIIA
ncbi:phage tail repeat-like family [Trichomonas vaginalis G3]|uniref:phage tail repeat-like family n=1 Tax=Trichomonas vaginalis (strain ATCC PRA-98 / G3) TaxID=412133 RepID=UPI0021E6163D|nr:phage tail repeat-like family [Trichomonas vaginalis G3]KAI5500315.1 phage tail repeat-like family [Trichomonas vaginalis G3]